MVAEKQRKKQKLRNNEYYDTQGIFDELYAKSKDGKKFHHLLELIVDERNVELAYRNIKRNKGSKTHGANETVIGDIAEISTKQLVTYVQNRLANFQPHKIRRVEIPKSNGKTRPLGIPTMEDRLIQQCIYQILEPICEARFYSHNYGFRPNRSAHHAVARAMYLININKLHYCVDIDIKGFFDNVNHGKLLKQLWTMGIQDKRLICIISKMLKAEIEGIGIPQKGTPQGGILSPLLANVVLNELDWWIFSQWEGMETVYPYKASISKYRALRETTTLKEMFIVRYADDFKIFCRSYEDAQKTFIAVQEWLTKRLGLEISPEKSKVINLQKSYSEFLGFKLKATRKGNSYVCKSCMSDKSKEKATTAIKTGIRLLAENNTSEQVNKYNSMILGMHNYYGIASHVSKDFNDISYKTLKYLKNQLRCVMSRKAEKRSRAFERYYGKYNMKPRCIRGIPLYPIYGVCTKVPISFTQTTCNFTQEGRQMIHNNLRRISIKVLKHLMRYPVTTRSVEYNDNRISLYVGQGGLCAVTKRPLQIGDMHCHHRTPAWLGGTDAYSNLVFVVSDVHRLIHLKSESVIREHLQKYCYSKAELDKINKLRILAGNESIA